MREEQVELRAMVELMAIHSCEKQGSNNQLITWELQSRLVTIPPVRLCKSEKLCNCIVIVW